MKHVHLFALLMLTCVPAISQIHPQKLSRKDSYWGLHYDYHLQPGATDVGKTITEEMIDSLLHVARPDYIQVDTKGHPGISSYPTKAGVPADGFIKDPLYLIRKVTQSENIALYAHHSGVMDTHYATNTPADACISSAGIPSLSYCSLWGKYSDVKLIPQIKELAIDYKLDGVWLDGESWAVKVDYHPDAVTEFKNKTGLKSAPKKISDPNYKKYLEFMRWKYMRYIESYTAKIHQFAPNFQICSNKAFGPTMVDSIPANIGVDFLSGDNGRGNSYYKANWVGRCYANQGLPFDIMAWGLASSVGPKSAVSLCQEAASAISIGAGFQVYFKQNPDLSFQYGVFPILKELADFVLPRREFCHGVKSVPQVGLFFSAEGWKNQVNEVYGFGNEVDNGVEDIKGVLNLLMDIGCSVDVLKTHLLKKEIELYPLIVVPDWKVIEPEVTELLKNYVANGGNLLLIGANHPDIFKDILKVNPTTEPYLYSGALSFGENSTRIECNFRDVSSLGAEKVMKLSNGKIALSTTTFGKGKVAGIYFDIGTTYRDSKSPVLRNLSKSIINSLFTDPLVEIEGNKPVHVVTTQKNGKLLIQLINATGDHGDANVEVFNEIQIVEDVTIILRKKNVNNILLQPGNIKPEYFFDGDRVRIKIPNIHIHTVIEVSEI